VHQLVNKKTLIITRCTVCVWKLLKFNISVTTLSSWQSRTLFHFVTRLRRYTKHSRLSSCFWSIIKLFYNFVANTQNVPVLKRFLTYVVLTLQNLCPFLCLDHVYEFITLWTNTLFNDDDFKVSYQTQIGRSKSFFPRQPILYILAVINLESKTHCFV
jgi:hypothetical protein